MDQLFEDLKGLLWRAYSEGHTAGVAAGAIQTIEQLSARANQAAAEQAAAAEPEDVGPGNVTQFTPREKGDA